MLSRHLPFLLRHQAMASLQGVACRFSSGTASVADADETRRWVFLGPPGVGKGTYASRIAKQLGLAHIATGDLIREEIKTKTPMGLQIQSIVSQGQLVPDDIIFELLHQRLSLAADDSGANGSKGFILDGFPRTRQQAEAVVSDMRINLALNLVLREEVLVEKCLGRRACSKCGKSYNIADIQLAANPETGRPPIVMPPLPPPEKCKDLMTTRPDDTEDVVRHRLQVYKDQATPVEDAFKRFGLLHSFELTQGIPQSLPLLLEFVKPFCGASSSSSSGKSSSNDPHAEVMQSGRVSQKAASGST